MQVFSGIKIRLSLWRLFVWTSVLPQDSLDEARQKIFNIREEYRNKLLEAERLRLEDLAAEEAARRVEPEKKGPAPNSKKKNKGKKQ